MNHKSAAQKRAETNAAKRRTDAGRAAIEEMASKGMIPISEAVKITGLTQSAMSLRIKHGTFQAYEAPEAYVEATSCVFVVLRSDAEILRQLKECEAKLRHKDYVPVGNRPRTEKQKEADLTNMTLARSIRQAQLSKGRSGSM